MFRFSERSKRNLHKVDVGLILVVARAITITEIDFVVTEGWRTIERQRILYASGASNTMNSRHLDGHAIDLAALLYGEVRWDWPLYDKIAKAMKQASIDVGVAIEWGGDWSGRFRDGPHFQRPWDNT